MINGLGKVSPLFAGSYLLPAKAAKIVNRRSAWCRPTDYSWMIFWRGAFQG
jgi:hypothetical protein